MGILDIFKHIIENIWLYAVTLSFGVLIFIILFGVLLVQIDQSKEKASKAIEDIA